MKKNLLLFLIIISTFSSLAQIPTNGLVAFYPFNGDAQDASGNNNHGTQQGGVNFITSTDRFGVAGKAAGFDGVNDYIELAGSNFQLQKITLSSWIKTSSANFCLMGRSNEQNSSNEQFSFQSNTQSPWSGMHLAVKRTSCTAGVGWQFVNMPNVINDNAWHHVVASFDGKNTNSYLDGILIKSTILSDYIDLIQCGNEAIRIAKWWNSDPRFLNGSLDDIRIYNRALTDSEVQALYQAEAPPIDITTGLIAQYKMDGDARDASGNGNHGTTQGGVTFGTDRFGNAGKAASFDGVDDFVQATSPQPLTTLTTSFWFKPSNLNIQTPFCMGVDDGIGGNSSLNGMSLFVPSNEVKILSSDQQQIPIGYSFPSVNQWYFISIQQNAGQYKMFVNNTLVFTGTGAVPRPATQIRIGSATNIRFFNGLMDDIRIYNRALTDTEVQALYQAEAPPIDITTGLIAQYQMDGDTRDASGNGNHGTAQNGVTFGTDRFDNAGKAASFDGVDSYVVVPNSASLQNINSITLSAWVNYTGLAADGTIPILDKSNSSVGGQYFLRLYNNGNNSFSGTLNGQHGSLSFTGIQLGAWNHLTMTSVNSTFTFYLNGQKIGSVSGSGTAFSNTMPLTLGANPSGILEVLNGKLDDIRIYNRALTDAEVGALYASENTGFQNINPMISYASGTVNRFSKPTTSSQILIVNGTNFTPNSNALLTVTCPNSTHNFSVGVGTNAQFSYPVVVNNTYTEGSCSISVKDISTKNTQISLYFTILKSVNSFDNNLVISNVNSNSTSEWTVSWSDLMYKEAIYGNSAVRNYRYSIEYGLANSSGQVTNWYSAGTFPINANGVAILGSTQSFTHTFNPQYATSAGNYVIRVTDYLKNTRKTSSKIFVYDPSSVPITDVSFLWDFTSGNRSNLLHGVAADSTSRFYIKVTPNISGITKVELVLEDDPALFPVTSTSLLGKVIRANVVNQFSMEANSANSTTSSNTQPIGLDYWFWYVAPDDFSRHLLDYYISERIVKLRVKYYNGSTLITEKIKLIRITRPPIMLVHGLGGDRTTWRNFKHNGVLFQDDPVFKVRNVLEMYGDKSFDENSKVLLGFDRSKYEYSFESTLSQIRDLGFAANRIDYVCHSMGGSMLRNTLHVPSFKLDFYSTNKNYGKGFVNKFITLDTPHWGSPLGDIVTEFAPYMNDEGFAISVLKWKAKEDLKAFFKFNAIKRQIRITTDQGKSVLVEEEDFEDIDVTDAVRDLSYRSGVRFANNNLNNHVILGDYVKQFGQEPEKAYQRVQIAVDKGALGLPILAEALSDGAVKKFNSSNCKNESIYLNELRKNLGTQKFTGTGYFTNKFTYSFMNWQSNRVYPTGETFFQNSDMIVSVESQANGQIRLGTNTIPTSVSVFEDITHNFEPDKVVDNEEVGNKVYLLLNTPLSSSEFSKSMQAAPAINSPYTCETSSATSSNTLTSESPAKNTSQNFGGGNKIQINQPITGSSIAAMNQLNVQISVLDTVNLSYVETKFQDIRTVESNKDQSLTYKFQANSEALGWQRMIASAIYRNIDSTFTTYTDTVWVNVITTIPLTSISANKEIYKMVVGDKQDVDLTAYHESFSTGISFTNPNLTIMVQDPTIIQYDSNKGVFTALKDGITSATATFNGQQTDILFYVDCGNSLYSLQSGNWNTTSTWSCGRTPVITDDVIISNGHTVTLPSGQAGFVKNLILYGTFTNLGNFNTGSN